MTWYNSLTAPASISAISAELSNSKTSGLSANHLLVALIQDYATVTTLAQALVSILTSEPILSQAGASARPTLSNVQDLLGELLQQVLEVVLSDWSCGDFLTIAAEGKLLNGTFETAKYLNSRLAQQE